MVKKTDFLGININPLTLNGIVDKILEFSLTGERKTMTYVNAHCINLAHRDYEYRNILNEMDLVYAGGMGVVWASMLFGKGLPERVNILEFFDKLAERLKEKEIKIFLLGAKQNVVQKASDELKDKYALNIVGYRSGFFDDTENIEIIEEINRLKPNILIVGMGVPKQEKWIYKNINNLEVNLLWAVGGAFNNLSGVLTRAPKWMIISGMEWLYRLFQEKGRLWMRYLIGNPVFIYHVLKYKVKR